MDGIINNFIKKEIKKICLSDKITGYLVKKEKRGTYQALHESIDIENEITDKVLDYTRSWLINELFNGKINEIICKEIKSSVSLELARMGYNEVFKKE